MEAITIIESGDLLPGAVLNEGVFALKMPSDGAAPVAQRGDLLLFDPGREVKSGDVCYVHLDGEELPKVRRVQFDPDGGLYVQDPADPQGVGQRVNRKLIIHLVAAVWLGRDLPKGTP